MNRFVTFHYTEQDINEIIMSLTEMYPVYLQEPKRLKDIIDIFDLVDENMVTLVIEENHIDKQYRDSYYSYFSQKYSDFKRNCIRLSFFTGVITDQTFMGDITPIEKSSFIGFIVLRPLNVGSIGQTLLNPDKILINGYVQTCKFKTMICGRKISINAFPFLTQDNETMTCAETSLFNLIQYYGQKYSEYRTLMPSEILDIIEKSTYERVLPSIGVDDMCMAKVLQNAHLHPRFYSYSNYGRNFDTIFHAYVESGLPFILGLPSHAIICIGHGVIDFTHQKHDLNSIVSTVDIEGILLYYLNTASLVDNYIFMDDNNVPYFLSSIDDLTKYYYNNLDNTDDTLLDIEDDESIYWDDGSSDEQTASWETFDDNSDINYDAESIQKMKIKYNSALVPLPRRIFLDADRALSIFEELFLQNPDFIAEVAQQYNDSNWGHSTENPIVWRIFLASSNSYKDFKCKTVSNSKMFEYYSSESYPRFIWVLEVGTLDTFSKKEARVEVILDATSSRNSNSWAILSVAYKGHLVYVPHILQKSFEELSVSVQNDLDDPVELEEEHSADIDWERTNETVKNRVLQTIFEKLYYVSNSFTPDTFPIYREYNLKGF